MKYRFSNIVGVAIVMLATGCAHTGDFGAVVETERDGAEQQIGTPTTALWSSETAEGAPRDEPVTPLASMASTRRGDPAVRLGQAEILYRQGKTEQAMQVFREVADADRDNAQAWLRIGNLLHLGKDLVAAEAAYRKAAAATAPKGAVEKALFNLALVNMELSHEALQRLDRLRLDHPAGAFAGRVPASGVAGLRSGLVETFNRLADAAPSSDTAASVASERPTRQTVAGPIRHVGGAGSPAVIVRGTAAR